MFRIATGQHSGASAATVGFDTTTGVAIRRSAEPPETGTRTGYTLRSSVTSTVSDFPSALQCGRGHAAIEILRSFDQHRRAASVGRYDRQPLHPVGAVFFFIADRGTRSICRPATIRARSAGAQSFLVSAFSASACLCFGDVDLRFGISIGIGIVIAGKRDLLAVGRPNRASFVGTFCVVRRSSFLVEISNR